MKRRKRDERENVFINIKKRDERENVSINVKKRGGLTCPAPAPI